MRYEMRSVAVWPIVKVTFLVSLVVGFCVGLLMALILAPMLALMPSLGMPDSEIDTAKFSVGALILFLPIFYALFIAVFNTIAGLIATGCYNLVAKWGGGLEFELSPLTEVRDQRPPERTVYGSTGYPSQPVAPPPPRQDMPGGDNI